MALQVGEWRPAWVNMLAPPPPPFDVECLSLSKGLAEWVGAYLRSYLREVRSAGVGLTPLRVSGGCCGGSYWG